jgi:DNA-binding transcriptional ArsR family regulator
MPDAGKLAALLKVLSVDTRVRIVQLLKARAMCVSALADRLDITQGAVSQHLRVMRNAGLLIDEKRGYYVHYRLNEKTLAAWRGEIGKLLNPGHGICKDKKGTAECVAMKKCKAVRSRKT